MNIQIDLKKNIHVLYARVYGFGFTDKTRLCSRYTTKTEKHLYLQANSFFK